MRGCEEGGEADPGGAMDAGSGDAISPQLDNGAPANQPLSAPPYGKRAQGEAVRKQRGAVRKQRGAVRRLRSKGAR